jgi:adenosine deaminase
MPKSLTEFIRDIPKCELHLHIEGTLEPELMFKIAERNRIKTNYNSVEELRQAYNYSDLQGFLNIYYESAKVLINENDFYDLTYAYLQKARSQNVLHTEIFFDPQTHTNRGIKFSTVINGINRALREGEKHLGITSKLIMCFLRDLDAESAFVTLHEAEPYKELITAIGLDSAEIGHPPSKFFDVFKEAQALGFLSVAHAGEEGPVEYIWGALDVLNVNRIDHGNRAIEDSALIEKLSANKTPLTMCPLSNLKLCVIDDLKKHPLKKMMEKGIVVTVNSDDPAYFGGYINENYLAVAQTLNLTKAEVGELAKNSFNASFLSPKEKKDAIENIEKYVLQNEG